MQTLGGFESPLGLGWNIHVCTKAVPFQQQTICLSSTLIRTPPYPPTPRQSHTSDLGYDRFASRIYPLKRNLLWQKIQSHGDSEMIDELFRGDYRNTNAVGTEGRGTLDGH
ncbi:unnamed protein product [Bursaphelenchus xylophilus]|uniref:(pine wood nematode) hypothetical protein n=1 Tax=Bursaphelenchus xylophilus TaxID=6326 RepID=A0A1I7SQG1_BURXY|nr:unnamed protein product [Bursaphelenchus xylophilus]CAG9109849.1 unnamed protein product [Bursaphelenchus xylophilus]